MIQFSSSFSFCFLKEHSISQLVEAFSKHNWQKPRTIFEQYLKEQEESQRVVWLAYDKDELAGYIAKII